MLSVAFFVSETDSIDPIGRERADVPGLVVVITPADVPEVINRI